MSGATEFSWSILLLVSCSYAWAQQDSCGSIGNSDETQITARRDELFYLNTGNPAPCTGNVTSWRVCYYGPGDSLGFLSARDYLATYAVYRLMGSGGNERYERVSEIFIGTVSTSNIAGSATVDAAVRQTGFTCFDDSTSTPVMVQAGDIVGACVFRPDDFSDTISTRRLDVVGETSGESLQVLTDVIGCSRTEIPSNIQTSQLSTRNSRRLHIYANIVPTGQPTTTEAMTAQTTTQLPTSTAAPAAATELPTSITLETPESDTTDHQTTANMTISQQDRSPGTITIATVSSVCGLFLLVIFVTVIFIILCFWLQKRKRFQAHFVPNNTETDTKNNLNEHEFPATVTINAAYNLSRPPQMTELDVMYDSVPDIQSCSFNNGERGDPNLLTLEQNAAYGTSSILPMELNAAYSTSNHDSVLPLATNVAYNSQTGTTTTNCEDYDYVTNIQ